MGRKTDFAGVCVVPTHSPHCPRSPGSDHPTLTPHYPARIPWVMPKKQRQPHQKTLFCALGTLNLHPPAPKGCEKGTVRRLPEHPGAEAPQPRGSKQLNPGVEAAQPHTGTPQPHAGTPQPHTGTPQPHTGTPQPQPGRHRGPRPGPRRPSEPLPAESGGTCGRAPLLQRPRGASEEEKII